MGGGPSGRAKPARLGPMGPSIGCRARGQGVGWLWRCCPELWLGRWCCCTARGQGVGWLLHHVGVVWRMTLKLLQCIASNFRNRETFAFREKPPCTLSRTPCAHVWTTRRLDSFAFHETPPALSAGVSIKKKKKKKKKKKNFLFFDTTA